MSRGDQCSSLNFFQYDSCRHIFVDCLINLFGRVVALLVVVLDVADFSK